MIGAQCAQMNELSFLPRLSGEASEEDLASDLAAVLAQHGGWAPALDGVSALINPDFPTMATGLRNAFARAADARAKLLISFVGHGTATDDAYFLHAAESPETPDHDTCLDFGYQLARQLSTHQGAIDGLVVLLDACQTGTAAEAAAAGWPARMRKLPGRVELLVASAIEDAYGGCFTRSIIDILGRDGVPGGRDALLVGELHDPINRRCPAQTAGHFTYNNGYRGGNEQQDAGLWLATNHARAQHALTGRPAAGLLEQVTYGLLLSQAQRETLESLLELGAARLRVIIGPPGAGKTTLMAFLTRPDRANAPNVAAGLVRGAAFLDINSTPEWVATELAAQLCKTLPGFVGEHRRVATHDDVNSLDALERELIRPLARLEGPDRVHLVIDGLDQAAEQHRAAILAMLARLTDPDDVSLANLRVIVGSRVPLASMPGLAHCQVRTLPAPTWDDVRHAVKQPQVADWIPTGTAEVPGGWLAVRLAASLHEPPTGFSVRELASGYIARIKRDRGSSRDLDALLALLAAAGTGPVLPLVVLQQALAHLGAPMQTPGIHDLLAMLGPIVQRGNAGSPEEHVGLAHVEIAEAVDESNADESNADD